MPIPDIEIKRQYSISQVNALTGIPKSTIRFWEKHFQDYLQPLRTTGNQRRYDVNAVEYLKKIQNLVKIEGLTLDGARKRLELEGLSPPF